MICGTGKHRLPYHSNIKKIMKPKNCTECGYPLNGKEKVCPECGCSIPQVEIEEQTQQQPQQQSNKKDMAQYFYECGVIGWNSFKKYFCFEGRASRREFWSFQLVAVFSLILGPLAVFVMVIPSLAVGVRRMHDIGRKGWWIICPIASVFMLFKQSDENNNQYGQPYPATNLLY